MYMVLAVLLVGIVAIGVFVLGMLFMKAVYRDAQEEARYDALRCEYFRLAGVKTPASPRPYVPPRPRTPRSCRFLPGMSQIDRLMREGKRGTVMWSAGELKGAGEPPRSPAHTP